MHMMYFQLLFHDIDLVAGEWQTPVFRLEGPPIDNDNDVQEFLLLAEFDNSEADGIVHARQHLSGDAEHWWVGPPLLNDDDSEEFTGTGPHMTGIPVRPKVSSGATDMPFSLSLEYLRLDLLVEDGAAPNTASAKFVLASNRPFTAVEVS